MTTSPALALPELPDAVAHVHSNADFCMDRLITPHDWPAYLYTTDQMATYGQQCAQAQGEAQAAEIARLRAALMAYADAEYCQGIEQLRRAECLGWEEKVRTGKFGRAEFEAHQKANRHFGAHFGIYAALKSEAA